GDFVLGSRSIIDVGLDVDGEGDGFHGPWCLFGGCCGCGCRGLTTRVNDNARWCGFGCRIWIGNDPEKRFSFHLNVSLRLERVGLRRYEDASKKAHEDRPSYL